MNGRIVYPTTCALAVVVMTLRSFTKTFAACMSGNETMISEIIRGHMDRRLTTSFAAPCSMDSHFEVLKCALNHFLSYKDDRR